MADADGTGVIPREDGFVGWRASNPADFNGIFGEILIRVEGDKVRCRIATGPGRANAMGTVHGGFLLACVDQVLFVASAALEKLRIGGAVTVAQSSQFLAPGDPGLPIDAVVEVVGETGRMLFLRGLIEQNGRAINSFEGTLRKLSAPVTG